MEDFVTLGQREGRRALRRLAMSRPYRSMLLVRALLAVDPVVRYARGRDEEMCNIEDSPYSRTPKGKFLAVSQIDLRTNMSFSHSRAFRIITFDVFWCASPA